MNINIRLNKNFQTQLNRLDEKYGEDFRKLQGLNDEKLSYTDFIDGFIDSDNVANASVDASANVANKDIVTLLSEMSKPHQKLLAFNKLYYEIQKMYGFKTANKALEYMWNYGIYMHDFDTTTYKPYCFAADLKDLAERGLFFIQDYNATPPKHLDSFVQMVIEWISFLSQRQSGAVGMPNLIPYMYYFWKKDVDSNYCGGDGTKYRHQQIQAFIYRINQPFLRGSVQTAFTNVSIFDHPYFEAIFGGSMFPDGSFMIDAEEEIIEFQKVFIDVVNEIRKINVFTFPILTASLLYQNNKFVDEEFARWACEANREWNIFNFFTDETVNSLSNCCFDGSQMTVTKSSDGVNFMTFKELYESPHNETKRNFTVFHNGSWVKGKVIRLPKRKMYKVRTINGKEIIVTDNHLNPTLRGDISTDKLTTEDYLMFNNNEINRVKEVDKYLTYEQGYLVGMYLGDGSMGNEEHETYSTTVHLSLNESKYNSTIDILNKACDLLNGKRFNLGKEYNNVFPLRVHDNKIADFIRMFVSGKYCFEKRLNPDCLLQSYQFRKGILDGYYATDGGNSNRIYTTSAGLVEDVELLMTSLGLQSVINCNNRTEEPCVFRGAEYNRNYPLYCIRWYEPCNRRKQKDWYIKKNNSVFFKIDSIEETESSDDYCYCFEIDNEDEPYFTLPNGIITHNCRLKSDITELYMNSIGGTALKVGSVKVSTLNLARLAYENKTEDKYIEALKELTYLDLQILDAQRHIIMRNVEKGLLPNFQEGLLDFEHLYSTVGINGIYEAMKTFKYTYEDEFGNVYYKDEAFAFGKRIFETIHEVINEFVTDKDYKINMEEVPAESAASKMMQADKFLYPRKTIKDLPLYGNQWIPLGVKATMQERTRICATFDSYCNGGSIMHINVDAPFNSFDKAWNMLNWVASQKVTYFAFTDKTAQCKNYHSFHGKICPVCGESVESEYSRIVGFYVKTKSYSKERKEEWKLREWMPLNEQGADA